MANIVKVRFATNRNRTAEPENFGKNFQYPDHPETYVTGSIDMVLFDPSKPDTGWHPVAGSCVIDKPVKALAHTDSTSNGETPAKGIFDFVESTRHLKRLAAGAEPFGIILIHGFAATFTDAVARAAQIKVAYGAAEVFCFSWPTHENISVGDYRGDLANAEKSAHAVADALAQYLSLNSGLHDYPNVQLVCHSMGNYAFRHAIQYIRKHYPDLLKVPAFRNAFLMAPDERAEALTDENLLGPLFRLADRVEVYHNGGDLVCKAGEIFGGKRSMGLWGPDHDPNLPPAPKLSILDCSDVGQTSGDNGTSHLGHQYYRVSPRVIYDVRQVIAGDRCIYGRIPDSTRPGVAGAFRVTYDPNTGPGCLP